MRLLLPSLAVSFSVATACDFTTEPVELLDLRVTVDRTVLVLGDTATIGFIAFNPTNDTIVFIEPHCHLLFEIRDKRGFVVAPKEVVCFSRSVRFEIAPDDSLTKSFRWRGDTWCSKLHCEELPTGTYLVQSVIRTIDVTIRSEAKRVELVQAPD